MPRRPRNHHAQRPVGIGLRESAPRNHERSEKKDDGLHPLNSSERGGIIPVCPSFNVWWVSCSAPSSLPPFSFLLRSRSPCSSQWGSRAGPGCGGGLAHGRGAGSSRVNTNDSKSGTSSGSSIIRFVIQVTVNGKAHRFEQPLEIAALLSKLELVGKKIAVERNGEIVPKSAHASTLVADGDELEIVVAVGGG